MARTSTGAMSTIRHGGLDSSLVQQFSHSDFAMRIAPIVLTTASQYLVAVLALRLFPAATPWLGFITVLLLQGTLVIHMSLAMAPEVPLLLAGLLVLWFTRNVLEYERPRDWLSLGLALGLAGLSKYTAVTLAVSVLLALWSGGRLCQFAAASGMVRPGSGSVAGESGIDMERAARMGIVSLPIGLSIGQRRGGLGLVTGRCAEYAVGANGRLFIGVVFWRHSLGVMGCAARWRQ